MANQITKLKNALGIGARANRYRVYINFPTAVTSIPGVTNENLCVICSQCDGFPSESGQYSSVFSQGRKFNLPKQQENGGDWNATFYNDEEHKYRNAFLMWMKAIDHIPANSMTGNPSAIMTDIKVAQLDSADNETVVCTFYNAFVTEVGNINFSGESAADVENFTVKFTYSHYTYGINSDADKNDISAFNNATKNKTAYEE